MQRAVAFSFLVGFHHQLVQFLFMRFMALFQRIGESRRVELNREAYEQFRQGEV